jgi:sortase A
VRRRIQIIGWTLIWSGVFVLGYAGWELYVTDFLNGRIQTEAQSTVVDKLAQSRSDLPPVEQVDAEAEQVEFHREDLPDPGDEFAVLRVDRLGLEAVVFEGVDRETLKKGPGHMPGTPLPGQPGNAVLSGHRTTYGRPFFDFDQLLPGDLIEVETAIGMNVYEVRSTEIVGPTDVWVAADRPGGWLTLTTCHPKFSARQRLIVFAELVDGPNIDYVRVLGERLAGLG